MISLFLGGTAMSNIALQIKRTASGIVVAGGNVIFDTIDYSAGNISYNPVTGVITFNETGRYIIDWWVATQATSSTNGVVFSITSSQGDIIKGVSPIKTGEVSGIGIVNVNSAPVTLSLANNSTASVAYSTIVPIKAFLMIVEDNFGAGLSSYAYIFNLDPQTVAVETDVTFSHDGNLTNILHTPSTSQIIISSAGDYAIWFSVSGVEACQFTLYHNNVPVLGSTYGSGAGTQIDSGMVIETVAAGDIITLRNHSSAAAVTLQTLAGGTQTNANASVLIEKLSS
jgi:hypothetical protein